METCWDDGVDFYETNSLNRTMQYGNLTSRKYDFFRKYSLNRTMQYGN